jgi:FecR protein
LFHFIAVLASFAIFVTITHFAFAMQKKEARVTQVIKDVRLIPSDSSPRPASINDYVSTGTAVRTGIDSRTELTFTDQTLTRLGANSIFSFSAGERNFDLGAGALLLCKPKNTGTTTIVKTAAATAAITGTTVLFENNKPWNKCLVVDGNINYWLNKNPKDVRTLGPGQIFVFRPWASKLPDHPLTVDLDKVFNTALLIQKFPQLPLSILDLILAEIEKQKQFPPSGGFFDPTSLDTLDQKAAAEPTPPPIRTGSPPSF